MLYFHVNLPHQQLILLKTFYILLHLHPRLLFSLALQDNLYLDVIYAHDNVRHIQDDINSQMHVVSLTQHYINPTLYPFFFFFITI